MIREQTKRLRQSNWKLLKEKFLRVPFCLPQIPRALTSTNSDITSLPTKQNTSTRHHCKFFICKDVSCTNLSMCNVIGQ